MSFDLAGHVNVISSAHHPWSVGSCSEAFWKRFRMQCNDCMEKVKLSNCLISPLAQELGHVKQNQQVACSEQMKVLFLALFTHNFVTCYCCTLHLQKFPWIQKDHKQIRRGKNLQGLLILKIKFLAQKVPLLQIAGGGRCPGEVSLDEKGRHMLFLWLLLFVPRHCTNWTFHLTQCSRAL